MNRCSILSQGWKANVKTVFGVMSLFLFLFTLPMLVEARDYQIRASDGEVYTVTLGEDPGVHNFSFRDADGEILRCVTEDERAVATELYFAAKFFWHALPWYSPENDFEDWEASVRVIAKDALDKLGQRQIATMVAQHSVTMLLIIGQPNLFAPGAADVISAINGAIAGELERAVLLNASYLAQIAGRGAVKHERILRGLWSSYETRAIVIPIDEINDASESHYKASLYLALASRLVSQYLQVPNFEERISTFIRSIVPFASKVETLASITYSNEHLQDLHALRENSIAGIHRESKFQVYLGKKRSRSELEAAGFFQPIVDTPLEDIRISIDDDPQRLDVRDYFSPKSDNLLYVPRADDESVAVARTETIGSSVIIITPHNTGRTSVEVTVVGPRDLSVTESFTVTVGQDIQPNQVPEPDGTIDHQLLLIDGPPRTLDMAEYFSWDNDLDYEVDSDPSGIVEESISGSRVTIKPRQIGNASVVVRAYDRNDESLYAIQTIPVLVYTNRATIVRPPSPTTFRPPTTPLPSVVGLRKGVSVITLLDPGFPLNVRKSPGKNAEKEVILGSGVTGIITDGPGDAPEDAFKWWKVRWDASGIEGWCVEWDRGQILYRRPPDLKILSLKADEDEVVLGKPFRLEAEVHNAGPGESAPTEIYFYYATTRHSSLEVLKRDSNLRVAGRGTVEVPSLGKDKTTKVSLRVEAPIDPDTYYYGALLPTNIDITTDYTDDLGPEVLNNNLAREVAVEVTSFPDLVVESISASKSILDPGEGFTLDATVRNQGLGEPKYNAILDYYRSSDAYISTRDREVGDDVIRSEDLDTNEIAPPESIRLSAPSEPGVYYYGACVDLRNESDTDNNCSGGVAITVRETNPSDLVVSLVELSDSTLAPGGSFTLEATVSNQGKGTARPTTLRGYRSANASISTNDTEIGSIQVGSLRANAAETQQIHLTVPLAVGTYYYGVVVDSVGNESNTANNNSAGVALTVENLAPVASGTLPAQTLVAGNEILLDVSAYFSDPNEDILTYYVFSDTASVVVAELSDLSNSELTLTPLAAGTATITVEVSDGEFTATQTIDVSVTAPNVLEEVWMPDANLRAAVRAALGLAPGDVLTQQALAKLTSVNFDNSDIKDLTGLEHATQLTALYLSSNEVVDISVLSGLTQLTRLDLSGNSVSDVSVLSGLTQLTGLYLRWNDIVDISALSGLTQLTRLDLVSNGLSDISVLSGLTQLTVLYLSDNEVVDISPLSGLTQLTSLSLGSNQISDVSPLEGLINLEELYLEGNPISDFAPLRRLTAKNPDVDIDIDISVEVPSISEEIWMPDANLRAVVRAALGLAPDDVLTKRTMQRLTRLDASVWQAAASEKISDLTGLEHAEQLTELDLAENEIVNLSPLIGLTQLTELDLSDNQVVDISSLSGLTQLTTLSLFNNEVVDIRTLSNLTQLTTLHLGFNDIVEISPLAGLTQLTQLILDNHNHNIVDISPLSDLTELTFLSLNWNEVVDISPLSGLTELTFLGLLENEIEDVSALEGLINLENLSLEGNPISDFAPLRRLKAKNPDVAIDIDISVVAAAVSEETWMPDANLREAVRAALGLEPGDVLTKEWMQRLTKLDASLPADAPASVKVSDLTGLEHATQLTYLDLYYNEVVDISALSGLTQLTSLDLWANDIVDISALSGLTQLTSLRLGGNGLSDISVLSGLTQLTLLSLWRNDIVDISVLSGLTQLTWLYLWGNEIVDVSVLSGLTQLTELYLSGNEIVDVSPLAGLTQLTELDLGDNEIVDVSPLSGLTQLTRLDLIDNEVVDISVLSGLTQLTWLYLSDNEVVDVSPLEGLTNLEELYLEGNPIADLAPLRRLKSKNPDMEIDIDISIETPVISGGTAALHVYWTLFGHGEIQRSNLDGTSVRTLFTKLGYPVSIAVDVAGGKIYWAINDFGNGDGNKIQRANLDGTNIQDIVTNELLGQTYIALDVAGGKIYWTNDNYSGDGDGDKIQCANLDGTNVQDIVTEELSYLNGIALDVTRKKIYWTQLYKIQRSNLDGTNVQDIFANSGGYNLFGIALDVAGGKVYWGNPSKSKIQRANLDGSNVQDFITGVEPRSIALDVAGGKVYWGNPSKSKIQRANLDGSNVEDIVTGVRGIIDIALGIFSQNPSPVVPVVREDVNRDGVIDLQDTAVVRANLGQTGQNDADVNDDNVVDVDDLVLVLAAIENAAAAPTTHTQIQQLFTTKEVQQWLTEAQLSEETSPAYLRGITMLEQILALLIPQETVLLANYPNPFNPETWIPYQLSKPADVTVSIYSVDGRLVRRLALGYQSAGVYRSRNRAAHWDGRNGVGEKVASGLYFYTFTAGSFTATRKMLIRK